MLKICLIKKHLWDNESTDQRSMNPDPNGKGRATLTLSSTSAWDKDVVWAAPPVQGAEGHSVTRDGERIQICGPKKMQ